MNAYKLLEGRAVADKILQEVQAQVQKIRTRPPHVTFLRVGNDGASISYVAQKEKTAQRVGITSDLKVFDPQTTTEEQLIREIKALNEDPKVDGILVQAPLPSHMDFVKVCNTIHPCKDVDGFSAENLGRLLQEKEGLMPCTPAGIIEMLKFYELSPASKHVVLVNRSLIVGKPLAMLLARHNDWGNATVTICHSHSARLSELTRQADILITACGKPNYFDAHFVKENAIVIDVGITRVPTNNAKGYTLTGDVNFASVAPVVQAITPVPGGVGPLTVARLMHNTLKAFTLLH